MNVAANVVEAFITRHSPINVFCYVSMDAQYGHACAAAAVIGLIKINPSFCTKSLRWIQIAFHVKRNVALGCNVVVHKMEFSFMDRFMVHVGRLEDIERLI
jgi:hypothetical protein